MSETATHAKPKAAAAPTGPTLTLGEGVYKNSPDLGEGLEFELDSGEKLFIRFGGNPALQAAFHADQEAKKKPSK